MWVVGILVAFIQKTWDQVLLLLIGHSAKNSIDQEERVGVFNLLVTSIHLPRAIEVRADPESIHLVAL